jgi:hypothetical protein
MEQHRCRPARPASQDQVIAERCVMLCVPHNPTILRVLSANRDPKRRVFSANREPMWTKVDNVEYRSKASAKQSDECT